MNLTMHCGQLLGLRCENKSVLRILLCISWYVARRAPNAVLEGMCSPAGSPSRRKSYLLCQFESFEVKNPRDLMGKMPVRGIRGIWNRSRQRKS